MVPVGLAIVVVGFGTWTAPDVPAAETGVPAPFFVRFHVHVSVTDAPGGCRHPTRSGRVCDGRDPLSAV